MTQIPEASSLDNLRLNLFHVVPYYLRGIFTRNPAFFSLLNWLRWHPFSFRFGEELRERYGSDYLYMSMLRRKTLFVFDTEGVRHILDDSPATYAEASLKRTGMGHFQPHAVTVSRGESWRDRREFNDAVLETDKAVHQLGDEFLSAVSGPAAAPHSSWHEFEKSFERIMQVVVLGLRVFDRSPTVMQKQLMRESNRVFGLQTSNVFGVFHGTLRGLISNAPQGLAALCPHAAQSGLTKPTHQMSHWMFAVRDTVASNTARALALIVAHPQAEQRVRKEIDAADLSSPNDIDGLQFLEGCVQEAMRLWPSTPLLVRETTKTDQLGAYVIPPKTQVVISNNYHHRDTTTNPDADRFVPDRWADSRVNYKFNHLSNGRQFCAGKNLALFLAKAFIAITLKHNQYRLLHPEIDPQAELPYMYNHFKLRFDCGSAEHIEKPKRNL